MNECRSGVFVARPTVGVLPSSTQGPGVGIGTGMSNPQISVWGGVGVGVRVGVIVPHERVGGYGWQVGVMHLKLKFRGQNDAPSVV